MEFDKLHYTLSSSRPASNSITLSSSRPGSRTGSRAGLRPALAKFHYAIQVADLVSDLSQTGSSYLHTSQTGSGLILLRYLLASWSQAG